VPSAHSNRPLKGFSVSSGLRVFVLKTPLVIIQGVMVNSELVWRVG
jgi:hypothetical protein